MSIAGVNTAMTTIQFARARSASRSVEANAATTSKAGNGRNTALPIRGQVPVAAPVDPARLVLAPTFHTIYKLSHKNGKSVAKRTAQLADNDYWPSMLNRLG